MIFLISTNAFCSLFGQSRLLSWIALVPVILYALLIMAGDAFYRNLALFLNNLGSSLNNEAHYLTFIFFSENYRTEEEYENFLIYKIVIFQCVSAFGSLFYIGFYLKNMKRLQEVGLF